MIFKTRSLNDVFGPADSAELVSELTKLASCTLDESPKVEQAIAKYPGSHNLRLFAAKFYAQHGSHEKAFLHLLVGMVMFPESPLIFREAANAVKLDLPADAKGRVEYQCNRLLKRSGIDSK